MPRTPARVRLVGEDGNAFATLAQVRRAMKDAGEPHGTTDELRREATRGDCTYLLATVMEYCKVVDGTDRSRSQSRWDRTAPSRSNSTRITSRPACASTRSEAVGWASASG